MTIEQLKEKVEYGDYTTLGLLLNVNPATAKMRFFRGNEDAKKALEKIIENRENLIKEYNQ